MTTESGEARYAIYWAPALGSALAIIGERWLGRAAETDQPLARPPIAGFTDEALSALTAEPRRYGLHATVKPPFRLARGSSATMLEAAIGDFARAHAPIRASTLRVRRIESFLALAPETPSPEIDALAAACVEALDAFRALPDDEELQRRRQAGLTARQEGYLLRWGYPYVMRDFRFHATLTGSIAGDIADRLMPCLEKHFARAVAEPLQVDELSLFVQPAPNTSFRIARRFQLGASII